MEPIELQARREALGLPQGLLADRLGVAQNTVSQWESGKRRIPTGIDAELWMLEQQVATLTEDFAAQVRENAEPQPLVALPGAGTPERLARVAAARAAAASRELGVTVALVETRDAGVASQVSPVLPRESGGESL